MTERTDHVAKAVEYVDDIATAIAPLRERDDIPIDLMTALNHNASRDIAMAQVHATLALVEQQRIANLIAIAQFRYEGVNGDSFGISVIGSQDLYKQAAGALGVPR